MRIAREGLPYIVIPVVLMIVLIVMSYWAVAAFFFVLAAFMAFFFRDPERKQPEDPNVVVAPADGRVTLVKDVADNQVNSPKIISIFLSPFDVHINRAPIAGEITDISYFKGKFLMATNRNASLVNEQNVLTIQGERATVVCKQIAGILARRIVCWKRAGDRVALGERIGLIKFSSRTDVVLPANIEVLVTEGTRVVGGTSIIGRIR